MEETWQNVHYRNIVLFYMIFIKVIVIEDMVNIWCPLTYSYCVYTMDSNGSSYLQQDRTQELLGRAKV